MALWLEGVFACSLIRTSLFRTYPRMMRPTRPNLFLSCLSFCSCDFFPSQVAIKNNIDVMYFAVLVPLYVLFTEDGNMEKRVFLATWKDIPAQNEVQYQLATSGTALDPGSFLVCLYMTKISFEVLLFLQSYLKVVIAWL